MSSAGTLKPLTRPRFNEERARAMWTRWTSGATQQTIGREFGLSNQRVSQILTRYQKTFARCYWCGHERTRE